MPWRCCKEKTPYGTLFFSSQLWFDDAEQHPLSATYLCESVDLAARCTGTRQSEQAEI